MLIPTYRLSIPATNLASLPFPNPIYANASYIEHCEDTTKARSVRNSTNYCRGNTSDDALATGVPSQTNSATLAQQGTTTAPRCVKNPSAKRTKSTIPDPNYETWAQGTGNCTGETSNDSPDAHDESQLPAMCSEYLTNAITTATVKNQSREPAQPTWSQGKLTTAKLEAFAAEQLPTSVQVQLGQTFGKDTSFQSFFAEKCFRHVLLPVLKSGYLSCRAVKQLERASYRARQLRQLIKRYAHVDFRPLQGFQSDWEEVSTIREDWKAMTSAFLLHFNGDVATVVRWLGGPHHTAEQIKPEETLAKLKDVIDPEIWQDLQRILIFGAPAFCNAEASEENFQAFRAYGNHASVRDNQEVFKQTIIKQSKRGLMLIMDPDLVHFALNVHLSPQGLVDVLHERRKPRPLSDSSFRPWPGAFAINDWTNKENEPSLHFADSLNQFCIWHWKLAITYPQHDRHTGDDNVQCAFPRVKYNPNLVGMHSAISNKTLMMSTGLTFGDNTSPSNWEPVARARQQLAQHLWHQEDIVNRTKKYLQPMVFDPPATPAERANFTVAIADSQNKGRARC